MASSQEVILSGRRTESIDAPAIEKLINKETIELFGRVDIVRVIEKANLAVTLVSQEDEVFANAAFFDYPNFNVDEANWEDLLQKTVDKLYPTALNTLFLNFFASKADYVSGCASEILRTVFNTAPYIEYIFLVIPPADKNKERVLLSLFHEVHFNDDVKKGRPIGEFHVAKRFEHAPKLHMRPASVEDHDDLMPIFDEQSETLINSYGDFFLNDLIEAEDEDNKCLVADVNNVAVGFMSISTNVNVQFLTEYFHLAPFNDLKAVDLDWPSVFCIELFCIDEKYEARSMDFLPAAFKLFPDKDYCVITMPHIVNEFPLIQEFTRISPKVRATISQELYVFHRWGLNRSIKVRPAVTNDVMAIENLVDELSGSSLLMRDVKQYNISHRDEDGQELQVFVAECLGLLIGVTVIRQEEKIEFIRAHFAIEDFIYYNYHQREEHGRLFHFKINPVFQHYTRHFLKETLRLSRKSCLYYCLYPESIGPERTGTKEYTMISCLSHLVPVRGRRQIIYDEEVLGKNAPFKNVLMKQEPFAIYHLNRKLTLEPKVIINARIVVVGASDVGLSFLEKFCFCPHLHFKNISLISPEGLPSDIDKCSDDMRPSSCCYARDSYSKMSLKTWVNIIEDRLVAIDRKQKVIKTCRGHEVPYDYLVLCCGEQFQNAVPTDADVDTLVTTAEIPIKSTRHLTRANDIPCNVYTINSQRDVLSTIHWIETSFIPAQGKAVIYGAPLAAYTFMESLLTRGVPGSRIVMVKPPQNNSPSCFNNPEIDHFMKKCLANEGVEFHDDYTLARWNHGEESNLLKNATFTSANKPLILDCQAFFCFQDKNVDYQAFKAINDSCLVYDGKLVVDGDFYTNDPAIRAAGSLTKFSRRYYVDSWSHANFNSNEVGRLLAECLLYLFDPTLQASKTSRESSTLIPVFKEPKIQYAILPGPFHYLHIGKPSLSIALDSLMAQHDYGFVLTTGAAGDEDRGYFRLHINQYDSIETITCFSKQKIDVENLICLYGVHARFLNNLKQRYREGLITDFYSFFRESWCVALFHDRFKDLKNEIREILSNAKGEDCESMKEMVKRMIDEDLELSPVDRDDLSSTYMSSSARIEVEKTLLNFLNYNSANLPMYARPGMV
ncbi:cilia- and flagella-associated protein 61-like [Xenia sp. Carnegie-2017]|uniref:cilia- and flagella-associated protein 61-like n=1 Tax=Xenia sp. Carnegie-2017 TaxID=2897299 RepID=UPI001F0462B8|nr:cilia- and flagella-associated protein 61-like [Xenia sp. Carnegie-2017]